MASLTARTVPCTTVPVQRASRRSFVCRCTSSGKSQAPSRDSAVWTQLLQRREVLLAAAAVSVLAAPLPAHAGLKDYNVNPANEIEEVAVQLGGEDGALAFSPSDLKFTAGKVYKLKMSNPSQQTHYFTALEFADKIYTVLVLAGDPATEVKGKVQEVALKPGATATWIFVPIKPGKYPLKCTVKGHTEGGMVGTITITPPAAAA